MELKSSAIQMGQYFVCFFIALFPPQKYTKILSLEMKLFTFPQFYFETRGQRHRTTVLKTDCVSLGLVEKANPEGVNRDLVAGISGILGLGLE